MGRKWSRAPDRERLERRLGGSGACPTAAPPACRGGGASAYGCDGLLLPGPDQDPPTCPPHAAPRASLHRTWLPFPASDLPRDRFQSYRTCPLAALASASRLWTWHSDKALEARGPASILCSPGHSARVTPPPATAPPGGRLRPPPKLLGNTALAARLVKVPSGLYVSPAQCLSQRRPGTRLCLSHPSCSPVKGGPVTLWPETTVC